MGIENSSIGILIFLSIILAPILYYYFKANKDVSKIYIRRIPGIAAIDEAVARATELGKTVSYTTGLTGVGPVLYACLGILKHIVKQASQYKTKVIIPQNSPEVMAMVEDTVRESYREVSRSSQFDPKNILYLSEDQFAFATGYMGTLHRENIGSTFLFGSFAAEALLLAEAGQQIDAMQVAGSVSPEQTPFFICTCDYTLIGEELFAASSYLTKDPLELGFLSGQDRAKLALAIMILAGIFIATWNQIHPGMELTNIDALLLKGNTLITTIVSYF